MPPTGPSQLEQSWPLLANSHRPARHVRARSTPTPPRKKYRGIGRDPYSISLVSVSGILGKKKRGLIPVWRDAS